MGASPAVVSMRLRRLPILVATVQASLEKLTYIYLDVDVAPSIDLDLVLGLEPFRQSSECDSRIWID